MNLPFRPWRRREEELEEELQSHMQMAIRDRMERGQSAEEAELAVRCEFGNMGLVKEVTRDMWGWTWFELFGQDLRYGARMLWKSPGFTLISVLMLALGIGANTFIFTLIDYKLLRPYQVHEPDRLVWLETFSAPNFEDCRNQNRVFESLAAFVYRSANLSGSGEPERVSVAAVSADFFNALKMKPTLGRGFLPEEDKPDGPRVAVLSEGFWRQRFGADPLIVGKTLTLDDNSFRIIGVMSGAELWPGDQQLWLPIGMDYSSMSRGHVFLKVIGRLKPGVSWWQAQAEMDSLAGGLAKQYPEANTGMRIAVVPLMEEIVGPFRAPLLLLQGAVGFILLIVSANVAGLLLTRGASREKEVAIRTAVGAGRWRLVRQLGVESMILAILGGALAALVIILALKALAGDGDILAWEDLIYLLGLTLVISLGAGLVFGLLPALQISSPDLNESLKEGGRGTIGFGPSRLRRLLVISELALTLILLAGAMLMIKRFVLLIDEDQGFEKEGVLTMPILLNSPRYSSGAERATFSARLISELSGLPEVESVGITANRPFGDNWINSNRPSHRIPISSFVIEGRPPLPAGQSIIAENNSATPDYFRTMRIPLLNGRVFTDQDTGESPAVVVISETMARRFWPGEDPLENPLGRRITINDGGPNPCRIVGVVGDVRPAGLGFPVIEPMMYRSFMQRPMSDINLIIRSSGDIATLSAAALNRVRELDRDLAVDGFKTMEDLVSHSFALPFISTFMLIIFAGLAIVLAIVGVYGLMSHLVRQRTREIGIRIALGAESSDVWRIIMKQGMSLAAAGVALGTISTLATAKLIASFSDLPFDVTLADSLIFVLIALLLLAAALMPCLITAWRATKIDPLVALRCE